MYPPAGHQLFLDHRKKGKENHARRTCTLAPGPEWGGWAQMGGGSGRAGLLSHRCGELGPPALVQMSHRISVVIVTASAASNPPALASLTILLGPVMADTTQAATQWGCGGRRGRLRGWRCGQCNSGSRVAYACRKRKRVGIKRVCCRACGVDASQGAAEAAGASLQ